MNHLILLMGENPLPNYVAARYLMEANEDKILKPEKIWVVCSEETKVLAENFYEIFSTEFKNKNLVELVELKNPRSPKSILNVLRNKDILKIEKQDTLHLNYTGGTKVMSVASFIQTMLTSESYILSYLDPQSYRLRVNDVFKDNEDDYPKSGDLRDIIIGIDTIINLHVTEKGRELDDEKDSITDENVYINWSKQLVDLFKVNAIWNFFKRFKQELDRIKPSSLNNQSKQIHVNINKLKATIDYPKNNKLKNVITDILKAYNHNMVVDESFSNDLKTITNGKYPFFFIHGKWLEYYIYSILKVSKIFDDVKINFFAKTHKTQKPFEIDVVGVKGYQVTLFSCYSGKVESTCKSKIFEAVYRADQLGGSEAKSVMVCMMRDDTIITRFIYDLECSDLMIAQSNYSPEDIKKSKILFLGYQDVVGDSNNIVKAVKTFLSL